MVNDGKAQRKDDPTDWLLEKDIPSVRYFALTELLDRSEDDPEVQAARAAIPGSPLVRRIFARQKPNGAWGRKGIGYFAGYKGTVWQLILLSELGVSGEDARVRRGVEQVLSALKPSGDMVALNLLFIKMPGFICLLGNTLRFLMRFGYGDDERTRRLANRLVEHLAEKAWQCPPTRSRPCLWGGIKALRGLAEIPPEVRTAKMQQVIADGAERFLRYRFAEEKGDEFTVTDPQWRQLGFSLCYRSDALEALDVLTRLGYASDERLTPLAELVRGKQDDDGRWLMEMDSYFRGKGPERLGEVGQPSKWVTLRAMRALKSVGEAVRPAAPLPV